MLCGLKQFICLLGLVYLVYSFIPSREVSVIRLSNRQGCNLILYCCLKTVVEFDNYNI